jgi:hypothetical protein
VPNLQHDPQNPSDLLGQPIAVGDVVAWGTVWGRSPALCVARIEKIRFVTKNGDKFDKNVECSQQAAEDYQLVLRPIKSTGDVTWIDSLGEKSWVRQEDVDANPDRYEAKTKTIHHVKNIVKLDPSLV